ncbi:MAG: DUF6164 family protein [Ghiorsea sp.]
MSALLFKLRQVEEDEADEIRAMLSEHDIQFYETTNGRWGLGYAAIWLNDYADIARGKELIMAYQEQRYQQARETYNVLVTAGEQPTLWRKVKLNPIQFIFVLLAVLFVAAVVLTPFMGW